MKSIDTLELDLDFRVIHFIYKNNWNKISLYSIDAVIIGLGDTKDYLVKDDELLRIDSYNYPEKRLEILKKIGEYAEEIF